MNLTSDQAITGVTATVAPVTLVGTATASCVLTSSSPQDITAGGSALSPGTAPAAAPVKYVSLATPRTNNAAPYNFVPSTSNSTEVLAPGSTGTVTWKLGSNTPGEDGSVDAAYGGLGDWGTYDTVTELLASSALDPDAVVDANGVTHVVYEARDLSART